MQGKKRLINDLSEEELLNLLDKSVSTENHVSDENDVLKFLSIYSIKPGKEPISSRTLHRLYTLWSKKCKPYSEFRSVIEKYFLTKKLGNRKYFFININLFSLTKIFDEIEEKKDKTKNKNWKIHFDKFLNSYRVKSGFSWIENDLLYSLYTQWRRKGNIKRKLDLAHFKKFLKLYLEYKENKRKTYFKIDEKELKKFEDED